MSSVQSALSVGIGSRLGLLGGLCYAYAVSALLRQLVVEGRLPASVSPAASHRVLAIVAEAYEVGAHELIRDAREAWAWQRSRDELVARVSTGTSADGRILTSRSPASSRRAGQVF